MAKPITAHEEPISRIFGVEYVFHVPPYQRPYAWTTEQAGELLDDLLGFMRADKGDVEQLPPYFLGSIVLIKDSASPNADVIDGQQRLTTLTILLAVIRSLVGGSDASDITQLIYEKAAPILGKKDRFRLTLRERDAEFFQSNIQREGGLTGLLDSVEPLKDSKLRIKENAHLYRQRLASLSRQELVDLAQFIVTRCFLVAVSTPDMDSAYRIFSVLNSRGLELSATDILKAEMIGAITEKLRTSYTDKWESTEEDLGRETFGDLFSHVRMVYRKAKPQGTLLREFREHVATGRTPETVIDSIVLPMASAFEVITDAAYQSTENASEVNEHLRWLKRLEFNDWVPPSLAFLVRKHGKPAEVLSFMAAMERLAYFMLATRAGVNERIERFSRVTAAVEQDADLGSTGSALQLSPHEQWRFYAALSGPIYETLSARACSTILLRLDSLVSDGSATYAYETITVEHVLPQTPQAGSLWLNWFPDPSQRANWVHRLGNLALLTRKKNSAASNYDFDTKKQKYFRQKGVASLALTVEVLACNEWTPSLVSTRHEKLLGLLERHWALQERQDPTDLKALTA